MTSQPQFGIYANRAFLSRKELQEIIQSSVFLVDCIYLPASIRALPTLEDVEQHTIHSRLMELYEIQAVKFWKIEGLTDFLTSADQRVGTDFPVEKVMSAEEFRAIQKEIIERNILNRKILLGPQAASSHEGIAEIVRDKHVLWTFALNDYLGASDIVLDGRRADDNWSYFNRLFIQVTQEVVQKVSIDLPIPDLSALDISHINECRKFMPAFRDELFKMLVDSGSKIERYHDEVVEKTAKAIVNKYFAYVYDRTKSSQLSKTNSLKNYVWRLAQLVFSHDVINHKDKFFKWTEREETPLPELLLWKLVNVEQELKTGSNTR